MLPHLFSPPTPLPSPSHPSLPTPQGVLTEVSLQPKTAVMEYKVPFLKP